MRSKSMDPGERDESLNRDASLSRSISADRARDASAHSTGKLSLDYCIFFKLSYTMLD